MFSMSKAAEAFRTISEVAADLDVPKHVLRFWEAKFPQIRPMKRGGGRRYYRPEDMDLLRGIRRLLHAEGYTIKGVQKILREQGVDHVKAFSAGSGPGKGAQRTAGKTVPPAHADGADGVASAAQTAQARKAPRGAPGASQDDILRAAIAELEVCRSLLRGDVTAAEVPQLPGVRLKSARG
jgi:DNA-binding transcriptional MerR regulator